MPCNDCVCVSPRPKDRVSMVSLVLGYQSQKSSPLRHSLQFQTLAPASTSCRRGRPEPKRCLYTAWLRPLDGARHLVPWGSSDTPPPPVDLFLEGKSLEIH